MKTRMSGRRLAGAFGLVVAAVLGVAPKIGHAECNCQQYLSTPWADATLAQEVAAIGLAHLPEGSAPFYRSAEEKAAAELGSKLRDFHHRIPPECRKLIEKRRSPINLTITATGAYDSIGGGYRKDANDPARLFDAYGHAHGYFGNVCTPVSGSAAYCTGDTGPDAQGRVNHALGSSTGEVYQTLQGADNTDSVLRSLSLHDIRMLQVYNKALMSGSEANLLSYLSSVKDSLTTDEKIALVRMFGRRFDNDYDGPRNREGVKAPGVVTLDQMLTTAAGNTTNGTGNVAGVCRDIASGQGKMLIALGLPNTYVLSFAETSASYHVTTITQDPATHTIYRLNYDAKADSKGVEGGKALFQGPYDSALNYRVYKPGGGSAADVPSEFGKFMAKVAGFDVRDLDPLARSSDSIVAANAAIGRSNNNTQVRIFYGADGNGATYGGGAIDQSWGQNSNFPGKMGLVLASQSRPAGIYGSQKDAGLDLIYGQLEQRLKTPDLKLDGGKVRARVEGMADVIFAVTRSRGNGVDGRISGQGDIRATGQLVVEQGKWNDRFQATYRAGVQTGIGITDIRNNSLSQVPVPTLNSLLFSAEGRLRLSKTPEGCAYLVAATTVLLDTVGARGQAELGFMGCNFGAVVAVSGRLNDNMPAIEDGVLRRVTASLYWRPRRWLELSLSGYASVERDPVTNGGFGVMANMTVHTDFDRLPRRRK